MPHIQKLVTVERVPTIQEVPHIQEMITMQRVPTIQRWYLANAKLYKLFISRGTLKRINLHVFISINQVEFINYLQKAYILNYIFSNKLSNKSIDDFIWSAGLFLGEIFLIVSKHE